MMQASPAGQWTAVCIAAERSDHDPCSPFFASRPEQLNRGVGQKISLHHKLADLPLSVIVPITCRLTECSFSICASSTRSGS
jgi:hypothetical protein